MDRIMGWGMGWDIDGIGENVMGTGRGIEMMGWGYGNGVR